MTAAILPVENLIFWLFVTVTLSIQTHYKVCSKEIPKQVIGTLTLLPTSISLINCSNISIYQTQPTKINLTFIYLFIHHLHDTTATSTLGIKM